MTVGVGLFLRLSFFFGFRAYFCTSCVLPRFLYFLCISSCYYFVYFLVVACVSLVLAPAQFIARKDLSLTSDMQCLN